MRPEVFYEPTADRAHSNLVLSELDLVGQTAIPNDLKYELSRRLLPLDEQSVATMHRSISQR